MKCLSLRQTLVAPVQKSDTTPADNFSNPYPRSVAGIELNANDRTVLLAGTKRVAVSPELLQLTGKPDQISRRGLVVTVYRASIEDRNGAKTLVPEKPGDDKNALVLIDLLGTPFYRLRLLPNTQQSVGFVSAKESKLLDDKMLAILETMKPLKAERYGKSLWVLGKDVLREQLEITFDGEEISYDRKRPN